MTKPLSRRQFLKGAAAGGATAAFAPLFGLNARPATAKPSVPERVLHAAAATTAAPFTALPSTTPLGAPLADIAMGADGTLWAIDTNGVPFSYDQLSQTWEVYAHQIDAITYTSRWQGTSANGGGKFALPIVVMGSQITSPVDGKPMQLASAFANLPTSFQLGLDGIAEVAGKLYLFRHGRYVVVDTSTANNAVVGSPVALTSLTNWPTTGDWAAGTFEALGSNREDPNDSYVHLFGYGEWMLVDLVQGAVRSVSTNYDPGPAPLHEYVAGKILQEMQKGFSALLFRTSKYTEQIYQDGVAWISTDLSGNDATPSYANVAQAAGWTPVLAHAPSGSASGLWGVSANVPVLNTGSGWQLAPYDPAFERCTAISAGSDGSVFCLTSDGFSWGLRRLQQDATWSATLTITNITLAQLEVGDATHIWARDTNNVIYRYHNGSFSTVSGFAAATHIAANADGTVWAANNAGVAYRFISEGKADATGLAAAAGTVTRVASTGFATAFALAQHPTALAANGSPATQLYAYDSPYVWKTSASYLPQFDYLGLTQSMVQAGHTLFVVSENNSASRAVYALDTQTGEQLWGPAIIPIYFNQDDPLQLAADINLAYDPALNLLYVGGGLYLIALNAGTGEEVWKLDYTSKDVYYGRDVWGPPSVSGGLLCVNDRWNGDLLLIDTAASNSHRQAKVLWNVSIPHPDGLSFAPAGAPLFDASVRNVYSVTQIGDVVYVTAYNLSDGTKVWGVTMAGATIDGFSTKFVHDALVCQGAGKASVLMVNGGIAIYAVEQSNGAVVGTYTLPQPPSGPQVVISSGLSYYNHQLFFGDSTGKLYVLNADTLHPATTTTDSVPSGSTWYGVLGDPVLAHTTDPNDGVAVLFARGDSNIWVFDPSNGVLESIATDQTRIASLLYDGVHGLLYGCSSNGTTASSLGQVFALRPDHAIQDERDFIIESQLMQDYHSDDEATNSNGNARYQTHVTIVDDNNVPMSNASVKLWAEEDGTVVSVDGGDPVTIGPDTPTLFTTDSSGSFTVISGGFANDGSDAADLFAVTLQVWAAFMNPSERIVITPDAEFHGRMAATGASGNTDGSQADPNGIDLSSTQSYDGTPLFATDSTNQSQASQLAGAITQVTGAVGAGASANGVQLRRTLGGRLVAQQTATTPKYHAYTDLPGMHYTPVSALVNGGLNPTKPVGISFTANGFATHTPGEAADLIDKMQGTALAGKLGGVLSSLRSAWKEIKKDASQVVQAAISIAQEVYVGITYVVDNVTYAIKAVAADIKDAMATIGSFFKQLGKLIKNAVEALSILLHFDEFIKTQKFIKSYYTTMTGRLKGDLDTGLGKLYSYLGGLSTTVKNDFSKLIGDLQGHSSTGVGSSSGSWGAYTAGTSPHSTMSVAPADGSAPKKSVAVQGMWAAHKSRQNASAASIPTSTMLGDAQGDIVSALESLFSDSSLFSNVDGITSQFNTGLSLKSPQAFFDGLFADILTLIEAAILAGIDIAQGTVKALQGVADQIAMVFQGGGELYIPIITPIWNKLKLPQFQIIDLITLIAAIPVTLIYRVISGHWLSQEADSHAVAAVGVTPPQWLTNAEGIVTSMITLFNGIVSTISDSISALVDPSLASLLPTPPWVQISSYANMALMAVGPIYTTIQQNGAPEYLLVIGLNVISNILSLTGNGNGTPQQKEDAAKLKQFISWVLSLLTLIVQWIADGAENQPWETIVSDIISNIPGCLSLLKYAEDTEVKLVPPIADIGCAVASAALSLAATITSWHNTTETREYRILLPVAVKS